MAAATLPAVINGSVSTWLGSCCQAGRLLPVTTKRNNLFYLPSNRPADRATLKDIFNAAFFIIGVFLNYLAVVDQADQSTNQSTISRKQDLASQKAAVVVVLSR